MTTIGGGAKITPQFKPLPKPLQLQWLVIDNANTSKTKLEANDLDAAREYKLADFNQAKGANPKIIGWDANSPLAWNDPCPRQLDINLKHQRDNNTATPWADANLRKALSLLIDRTRLAHVAYGDTTQPSSTMFAQYGAMQSFIGAVTGARYGLKPTADAAGADMLLRKAGYQNDGTAYKKGSEILSISITVANNPIDVGAANELETQLNAVGIKAKVDSISNEEFWGKVVPTGGYETVYGWLSCGSVSEPYTSMSRYLADKSVPIGQRSPGFDNTGRWDSQPAKDYSTIVAQIDKLPMGNNTIPGLVANAYKYLDAEMPFIPLVQSPTIIPFNTTYWTGWPAAGGNTVPMHNWAATHRLIHQLKSAN